MLSPRGGKFKDRPPRHIYKATRRKPEPVEAEPPAVEEVAAVVEEAPAVAPPLPPPTRTRKKKKRLPVWKRPPKMAPRKAAKRLRPSLAEQLAGITAAAEEVATEIKALAGGEDGEPEALLTTPSRQFIVGRLESRLPSPVKFFEDRCEYIFNHPYEDKQITMIMLYRDMCEAELLGRRRIFRFRIDHALSTWRPVPLHVSV
eukprot:PLAT4365.2.p2 GENE.PLAT4365.2~~PLAT4365.2.p2  ORF type:complete len:202 (+),score=56.20 PLAT4365.2:484-1089(+)